MLTGGSTDTIIDDLDRKIIACLIHDGRMSNSEIARRVNVTESTVRNRIKKLTQSLAIKVSCVFQPSKLGYLANAMIHVRVQPQHLMDVSRALMAQPEVRYVGITTGRSHIVAEAIFPDNDHLLRFLSDRISSMPGIRDIHTNTILRVEKMSYMDFATGDSDHHPFSWVMLEYEGSNGAERGSRESGDETD